MTARSLLKPLLAPLSWLYGAAVTLRNTGYDRHLFPSTAFPTPVIAVGNITAGGTGKTPHTELLVTLLRDGRRPAVLSRGYKRRTKGFRYVETTGTAADNGDEPLQIKQKFPALPVAVDADRVRGIRQLLEGKDPPDVIILDDAFQHRRVRPALSLLLIDCHRPPHRDRLLPWGRLRDRRSRLRHADIICITKCPGDMPPEQRRDIARTLPPGLPLFFTAFEYGEPEAVFTGSRDGDGLPETENCLLLTGIANPAPLERHLQEQGRQIVQRLAFRDHHAFTPADVRRITAAARCWNGAPVFTTEKDAVRLRETSGWPDDVRRRLFFLPITVRFLPEETPPAPEGSRRQQELFKQIIIKKLWNAPPKPSNSF